MLHETSRRSLLGALTVAPAAVALATVPTPLKAVPAGSEIHALWSDYLRLSGALTVATAAWEQAEALLPWWAAQGQMWINSKGEFCGDISGWPARQDYKIPPQGVLPIRIGPSEIRQQADHLAMFSETSAQRYRTEAEAALARRTAEQQRERELLNLDALGDASDAACDRVAHARHVIASLAPHDPNVLAAQILVAIIIETGLDDTVNTEGAMPIAAIALRGLLPSLTGEIARDAAELVGNPDRPICKMRVSRGIMENGGIA